MEFHTTKINVSSDFIGFAVKKSEFEMAFQNKPLSLPSDLVSCSPYRGGNEKGIGCKSRTVPLL
jgi:hypothetical protein